MKELTIEEKAKAYDEAWEKAKKYHSPETVCNVRIAMENLFPELAESEDERIRKWCISHFKGCINVIKDNDEYKEYLSNKVIAWLENRGEQSNWKPSKDEMDALYGLAYITNKMDDKKDEAITKLYQDLKREFFNGATYENMFPSSPVDSEINIEKQGEQKPYGQREECLDCQMNYAGECKGSCAMKRDEQKPADKIEPKFKIGDWIAYNHNPNLPPRKIIQITNEHYIFNNGSFEIKTLEADWHLWTIQDAKDGDMLYNKDDFSGNSVFIYKSISDKTHACLYYTRLFKDKNFSIYNNVMWEKGGGVNGGEFYPATKEQRDTLMKAMADAGYTFDFEKKELKKIEQKPADWSEEDENNFTLVNFYLNSAESAGEKYSYLFNWFKDLKDRVQPQPKQEWSEEDEKIINDLLWIVEAYRKNSFNETHKYMADKSENWLKSLRSQSQWKPTLQQINALSIVVKHGQTDDLEALKELYEQLKAL